MVKKKLGDNIEDLNLDSLDKDFDIDTFDIESFDVSGRDPSKENKGNRLSEVAKYLDVRSFSKSMLDKLLPKEYATTLGSINENLDVAKSLYDKSTSPIRDSLRRNNRTLRELTPQVSRIFGKSIADKYLSKIEESTPYTPSNSDDDDNSVKSTLNEIFGEQQKQEEKYRKQDMAQQLIRDRREDLRFNRTFAVSKGIYDVNKRILDYHEQIDYKYKMKSMELKVRTYIEMRKHHMLAAANMNDTSKFLKQLVHNSTLPDIQKMRLSEQAKGMFRERLIGGVQAVPGMIAKNYLSSIAGNAGAVGGSTTDMALELLSNVLDAQQMGKEYGGGGIASAVGPLLSSLLGTGVGKWLGKKTGIRDSKGLKNSFNKITYVSNNFQKMLMGYLQNKSGLLGAIGNLGNKESLNLSVRRDTLANSTQPAVYDNASRKSIVEIIPGLLSRILKSTEGIRTGKDVSMTVFDHNRNEFTTESELVGRTLSDFKNDSSLKEMQSKVDELMVKLIGNKKVSGKTKKAIRNELYNRLMKGEMFSPQQLGNPGTYRERLDDKTAVEIKEIFSGYSDQNVLSKEFWTSDKNTAVLEMDKLYNDAMSSHPDLVQKARMLDSVGQKDLVKQIGLLNAEGDISVDKLIDFYSGRGKVNSNEQRKSRFNNSISNGRYGSNTNNNWSTHANSRVSEVDESLYSESNQILSDIRDAMATAQEVKNKILTVEEEIRNIVQGINDYLPQINSTTYNISGDELSEKFYSKIKSDVNGRFRKARKSVRRGIGGLIGAIGKPFSFAKSGILSLKDRLCDVYVQGREGVALYASKLREGKYFDQATGKVIKKLSDIKGAVIDEEGNIVLTLDDIKAGLFDSRGKKIVTSLFGKIAGFGSWVAKSINMLNPLYHVGKFTGRVARAVKNWWVDESMDVYVVGESSPRLLKIVFQNRGYYSKITGRPLTGADKIDGEVVDKEGNVILSNDDIKKGLVDKYGKPLKFGIGKYISRGMGLLNNVFIKPLKGAAKLIGKGVKATFKGVAALGRFLFGSKFSEAAADKALPEGASLEARYLNRIYYFLRSTFGGAVNGIFNRTHQAVRGAGRGFGNFFSNLKDRFSRKKSNKQKMREKYREKMEEQMEKYRYKRWFIKVKNDRIKDEENRKNSWRWKLKNKFKPSTPKQAKKVAMKKFGWLGFVLGGIASLGWFIFKKLTSSLFKLGKLVTKGLGKIIGPLARGLLKGAGSLALNAAKLGGRALGSVAMWAGRGLISAAPAILSNPVGLTVAAVALVAVGGYLLYKWWSGRLKPLQKYRYTQYGADLKNDDVVQGIAAAEKYFYDHLSFSAVGKPPVMGSDFDAKYFAQLCGCQLGDQNDRDTKWWCSWFDRRFVPVAIRWAMTMQEYAGSKPFYDADNILKDSQKLQFALKVGFDTSDPNCPYNLQGGPSPFVPTTVGNGAVLQQLNEIREEYFEDMPKSEEGTVKLDQVFTTSIKSDAKLDAIGNVDVKSKDELKVDISVGNHALLVDKNNLNGIQLEEDIIRNQETSESATAFTWVRLLCYGFTPAQLKQASLVNKLLALEQMLITDYISFKGGKAILLNSDMGLFNLQFAKKLRGLFGWSDDYKRDEFKLYGPAMIRFLAVAGRFLALANSQCPGVNIFDVYKQKNDVLCPIAKSLVNTNLGQGIVYKNYITKDIIPDSAYEAGTQWNIWMVTGQLVQGTEINTDFKTVQKYIDDLDPESGKTTGAKSDTGGDVDGAGTGSGSLRDKYGIGSGGGMSYDLLRRRNGGGTELDEDGNPVSNGSTNQNNQTAPVPIQNPKTTLADIMSGRVPGVVPKPNKDGSITLPPFMTGSDSDLPIMMRPTNTDDGGDQTYSDMANAMRNGGQIDGDVDLGYGAPQGDNPITRATGQRALPGQIAADGTFLPTESNVVTSLYGMRNLHDGRGEVMHKGIDLRAAHGDDIRAYSDGVITMGWNDKDIRKEKYGTIIIDHGNGLVTKYLHTSPASAQYAITGRRVKAGDIIGKAGGFGPKGNETYDPHLHFQVEKNKQHVNPLQYLLGSGFTLAEKRDDYSINRLDKPYRQEDKRTALYRKSKERVNELLASTNKRAPKQKPVTDIKPSTPSIEDTASTNVGNNTKTQLPSTGFVEGDNPLAALMNPKNPSVSGTEVGDDGQGYLGNGIPPEGGDVSVFAGGDSRIDALRQANNRQREATLIDTNNILIDNMAVNKAILQQITDMNSKVGKLVETSSSVASIMVGGREIELKQTPKAPDGSNAFGAPNKITRTKVADPFVSFNKKAV